MFDVLNQVASNLRAHKLRSLLTMFGILWGVVSVVVLSATGEGFRLGNDAVPRELGVNISVVRGGGARRCRRVVNERADAFV